MFDLTHGFIFFLIGCTVTFVGFFIAYMVASRSQEKPRELTDIEKQFGISRAGIYNMMAEGRFPKPVKLGERAVGWLEEDLKNWLDNMQETK